MRGRKAADAEQVEARPSCRKKQSGGSAFVVMIKEELTKLFRLFMVRVDKLSHRR